MIRIALAVALVMTFALPAEARGLKLRLPHTPVQHVDKYPFPIVPGLGHSYRSQSDCGSAPKRPCTSPESSPLSRPSR